MLKRIAPSTRAMFVVTAVLMAHSGQASADVIEFTELPPGTVIDGATIGAATFAFDFADPAQATIATEGGPLDGPFATAPYLLGDIGGVVRVNFDAPVRSFGYDFVIDDTIMSSVISVLEVFDAAGNSLGTVMQNPGGIANWPALGDAVGGQVEINGVGPIASAEISYDFLVFSTTFVLDNVRFQLAGDVNGDGAVNVTDLLAVLSAWGACPDVCDADLDGNGVVDIDDLLAVLQYWS